MLYVDEDPSIIVCAGVLQHMQCRSFLANLGIINVNGLKLGRLVKVDFAWQQFVISI